MASLLASDDPELADIVRQRLRRDGIAIHEAARITGLAVRDGGRWVTEDLPVVLHVGRHAGDPESLTLHTELHPG